MKKIGIIGSKGMVGGAMKRWFKKQKCKLFLYDIQREGSVAEINKADYIFICVPTPTTPDGRCDVSAITSSLSCLGGEKVVIIKSTILPGTTAKLQIQYPQHKLLFNPEFLTEATADQDMAYPDRQIIGYTKKSYNVAKDIMMILPLAPFERLMTSTKAEMIKYMANSWFANKVAFANQIYDLCQKIGINYDMVRDGCASDKRIGRTHLDIWHKGYRGFSGKCLVKDLKALIAFANENDVDLSILKEVDRYNEKLNSHN